MNSSFYNGISGIKTHQFGIDVWADNIANVNKVGSKTTIPEFSTVFSTSLNNSPTTPVSNDVGLGSRIGATHLQFNQGSITQSENPFDMAINGEGWFGIMNQAGEQIFTRAGIFNRDAQAYLTDPNGNYLLGAISNNIKDGAVVPNPQTSIDLTNPKTQSKIQLPDTLTFPAKPTSKIDFKGPLNSEPIYEADPNGGKIEIPNKEKYATSLINPDGSNSFLEINFTKIVPQSADKTVWTAKAILSDKDNNVLSSQEGQLDFNDKGGLTANTLHTIDNNGIPVALNFGSLYNPTNADSGYDGIFSYHGKSANFTRHIHTDGEKSGELENYRVGADGTIEAAFSNGKSVPLAKVALYHFQNNAGLEQSSPVYFKQTANSGEPLFFKDANGKTINTATISGHALEVSNISMTTALTELIVMQKAFDASAKSITTSDQLIQNAINMKK